jgi:tetratricopeptide (TPR) repeat protein
VLHRDIKPSNLLITATGEAKLIDFGIAKDLGEDARTPTTRLGPQGTLRYASPEQITAGTVTTATDVYALGVVLYELLTGGESPFDGDEPLAGRTKASPPAAPSTRVRGPLRRRLTGDLDHVVLTAVAPEPEARFQSVEELDREIGRYRRGLPLESRPGSFYRVQKLVRCRWKELAAVVVLAVLSVGLAVVELGHRRTRRLSYRLGNYLVEIFTSATTGGDALDKMLGRGQSLLTVEEEFQDEPELRAVLLGAIGQGYRRLGRFTKVEPLLRECLALRYRHYPKNDEYVGVAANNLALALRGLGRYVEAEKLLRDALRIRRLGSPRDHEELASMINNLAGIEKELGQHDEAVAHYQEALDMKRRLLEDARSLALALKNLGTGLRAAGRLDEAEDVFRQALGELEWERDRAGVELHLGGTLRERGKRVESRERLESALAEGSRTDDVLLELARLDQAEGHLDVAGERLRRVLEMRREESGDDHPDVGEALVALARLLAESGDLAGARAAATEASAILRACLPAEHGRIAEVEELLGR